MLLFGTRFDGDPLPYTPKSNPNDYLIRKILLTREVLHELPPEDYVLYLDATDTLIQRGGSSSLLRAFAGVVLQGRQFNSAPGNYAAPGTFAEPVVFAGQAHCFPFELWSPENVRKKETDRFYAARVVNSKYEGRIYGLSGVGVLLRGPEDVCSRLNSTGSVPFADSGTWMGRVASAQHLFGVMASVASSEQAGHCMEVLKLVQVWFPGLVLVDVDRELFWTTELEVDTENGWRVGEKHAAVVNLKMQTERDLCVTDSLENAAYWDDFGPPRFRSGGPPPFTLHYAGPAKGTLGRRCKTAYSVKFILPNEHWFLRDLDAASAVKLSSDRLGYVVKQLMLRGV